MESWDQFSFIIILMKTSYVWPDLNCNKPDSNRVRFRLLTTMTKISDELWLVLPYTLNHILKQMKQKILYKKMDATLNKGSSRFD